MRTCFTGTKVLALLVQRYLLTGTKVQILTPEEDQKNVPAISLWKYLMAERKREREKREREREADLFAFLFLCA